MIARYRGAIAVALLALATACTRGTPSGRLDSSRAADEESLALAKEAVAQYRLRIRPSPDAATTARAARVGQTIIDAAKAGPAGEPAGRLAWQIVVVESPNTTVATFANGAIFVDDGLVRRLSTDDALAAALGHAVARVLLWQGVDSGTRRARNGFGALTGMMPSMRGMGESERERTEEADYAGLVLAIEAGYDLDRALEMFDRLGLKERGERARKHATELRESARARSRDRSAQPSRWPQHDVVGRREIRLAGRGHASGIVITSRRRCTSIDRRRRGSSPP